MIGQTNIFSLENKVHIQYGMFTLGSMSTYTSASTTWRYKQVSLSGFSAPPSVQVTVDHITNSNYGLISVAVRNVTTTSAVIIGAYNLNTDVIRLSWCAIGWK